MNRSFTGELKKTARTVLLGKWGFVACVCMMELMWNTILRQIVGMAFPGAGLGFLYGSGAGISIPYLLCLVIVELLSTILSAGSMFLYLNICRGQPFRFGDLFYGFTHQPEHIVGYFVVITAATFLFSALPAIFLVMALTRPGAVWIIGLVVSSLLCAAGYFRMTLGFAMFPFLYADAPWKTSRELLRESAAMMKGHKMRYFYLQVSFLGMILLGMLSMGIGMIWVEPYIAATNTEFYLEIARG